MLSFPEELSRHSGPTPSDVNPKSECGRWREAPPGEVGGTGEWHDMIQLVKPHFVNGSWVPGDYKLNRALFPMYRSERSLTPSRVSLSLHSWDCDVIGTIVRCRGIRSQPGKRAIESLTAGTHDAALGPNATRGLVPRALPG